ncbi:hypothetical protein FQZ97_870990 [compost metagenome]
MELGFFAGVSPLAVEQVLREVENQAGGAHVTKMLERHVCRLADDAGILRLRRAHQVGREHKLGFVVEVCDQTFFRQLDPIAFDTWKDDLQRIALGAHRFDLHGFARCGGRCDDGFGCEVEGDAEHVGVFDVEQALVVQLIGLAAQCAADDLFAQKLGAEGADAEHVGNGIGIPTFCEHRYRHNAADRAAQLPCLADRVHNLAQELLIRDLVSCACIPAAFDDLAAETLDLIGSHAAEVVVQRITGLKLFAVDKQRVRAW